METKQWPRPSTPVRVTLLLLNEVLEFVMEAFVSLWNSTALNFIDKNEVWGGGSRASYPSLATPPSHARALVQVLAAPTQCAGKASGHGSSASAPVAQVGDLYGVWALSFNLDKLTVL